METRIVEATLRIEKMEALFDELLEAFEKKGAYILFDEILKIHLSTLTEYYEGGEWMADFELDELGVLPNDLKRGILSEDRFYNFLFELDESKND